jgi:hypothetical protein
MEFAEYGDFWTLEREFGDVGLGCKREREKRKEKSEKREGEKAKSEKQ